MKVLLINSIWKALKMQNLCLLDIHNDLLAQMILKNVPIQTLSMFMSSCRTFHNQRKAYLDQNHTVGLYSEYDNNMCCLDIHVNSHMFNMLMSPNATDVDSSKIENTTKITGFLYMLDEGRLDDESWSFYDNKCDQYYFSLINKQYGYPYKCICQNNLAQLYLLNWWHTNINIYDLYKIIYHIAMRKYKNLKATLKQLKYIKTIDFKSTINFLISFFESQYKKTTNKIAILYIIYDYINMLIETTPFLEDPHNEIFARTIVAKTDEFAVIIKDFKQFPKYIRQLVLDKMNSVTIKIQVHLV